MRTTRLFPFSAKIRTPACAETFNAPVEKWKPGIFNAPHGCSYDKDGQPLRRRLNKSGRISKMMKVAEQARAGIAAIKTDKT